MNDSQSVSQATMKSVNLQYDTLGRLDDESSTKHLMFQVLFFLHGFLRNSLQNILSALSLKEIMKKIISGTSDALLMSRSSQWPSEPAYYIEDCWIYVPSDLAWDSVLYSLYFTDEKWRRIFLAKRRKNDHDKLKRS